MKVLQKVGFSKGDLLKIAWLQLTQVTPMNAKDLHQSYTTLFPSIPIRYEYVAKIANRLENNGDLKLVYQVQQKKYYQATPAGIQTLANYNFHYQKEIQGLTLVMTRIYYELTKTGEKPASVDKPLPEELRGYMAKLISVKDITRYMIFKLGKTRSEFYAAEALDMMNNLFGWSPSNGYFYEIVSEMESEGTIVGKWKDDEKRTVRLIKITNDGVVFSKLVTQSLTTTVKNVLTYLFSIEKLVRNH